MENPAGGPGNPKRNKLNTELQYENEKDKSIEIFKSLSEERGFSLIPLDGKVPKAGYNWQQWCERKRPFNPHEYRGKNAGVCCGPASRVIVLDKDDIHATAKLLSANGWDEPESLKIVTGTGFHLYFQYPDDGQDYGCKSIKHPVFPGHTIFDIKSKGGQVVAPGSIHPDTGKPYKILKDLPIAAAPKWLLDIIHNRAEINFDTLQSIPPSKVSEKILKSMVGITDSTKELILKGHIDQDRSRAGMSVLKALVGAGIHENIIFYIFDNYQIGEKYREKGNSKLNWLTDEIRRAREHNQQSHDNKNGTPDPDEPWEKPIPLSEVEPPPMPSDILPGILGEMTRAVSEATETPIELSIGLILAVIASTVHNKYKVVVKPDYSEPLQIWTVSALESGNRKSAVQTKMVKPLIEWESEQAIRYKPMIDAICEENKAKEARIEKLRKEYAKENDPAEADRILKEIATIKESIEQELVSPRVWAQDVTPEHLGAMMYLHNEAMALLSAEGGIFDIMGGRYSKGVPNLDLFLQGHSGDSVRVDRNSRETVFLNNPSLTMGLSPQPEVLQKIAGIPGFRGRGLLARPLYSVPKSPLGYRKLETPPIPEQTTRKYNDLIHRLLDLPIKQNEDGTLLLKEIGLTKEAYSQWFEFSRWVEVQLKDGGKFEFLKDWAGKLAGAAVRLAGLIHCSMNPDATATNINLETMKAALALAAIYAEHARLVFDLMGADPGLQDARRVWLWIERNRYGSFTKRDCFEALKGHFHKMDRLNPALQILEERHHIRSKEIKTGARPSFKCIVNPMITEEWS